jgi:hypothetical protein
MQRWHAAAALALFSALVVLAPALAAAEQRHRCAVKDLSSTEQALVEEALSVAEADAGAALSAPRETITIPVHWHVITTSGGGANVSGLVPAQMAVLNAAYQRAGFQFSVASLEVVANDAWFFSEQGSIEEQAMKAALRVGGPGDLNVYTTNGDIYLGWATFPIWYPRIGTYDGVVLYWATLPGTGFGGPVDPALEPDGFLTYDGGDTATHEVGHWLGLYHTFQGGCSEPGDHVKGTPAEAEPQFFCAPRDSCGGKKWPGLDPIKNFMDYVDDVCMDHFTVDQERRMYKQWKAFRRR